MLALETAKEKIFAILSTYKTTAFQKVYSVFDIFEQVSSNDQIDLFVFLSKNFRSIESSEEVEIEPVFSAASVTKLKKLYGSLVDGYIDTIIQQEPKEADFYETLWRSVMNSTLLVSMEAKAFALYYILVDKRIPYYYLGSGLHMSNEEYRDLLKEHQELRNKIRFLMAREFEQKTERASILLDLLDTLSDPKARAVMMVAALDSSPAGKDISQLISSVLSS